MSIDPELLAVMRRSVDLQPNERGLRVHLLKLLHEADLFDEGLSHVGILLSQNPLDLESLQLGVTLATKIGDTNRATGYAKILSALQNESAKNLINTSNVNTNKIPIFGEADSEFESENINEFEREKITFADVKGLNDVKRRLELSFLGPLRNPDLRLAFKKSLRGGLLLYGPPGCGKTFIARAVAGELGASFISIGINDVMNMYIGESERRLNEIFNEARRKIPCVIFLDELDALGRKRSLTRESNHNSINQLLEEMDGIKSSNENLYIIGASNHPWDIESALKRPGRLDRTILVLPPDSEARISIARQAIESRPNDRIDFQWLAKETDRFSAADIVHLVDSATEYAFEDSSKSGKIRPVNMDDFKKAKRQVKSSIMPWLETAKNFALYSNDSGSYDDLLDYLRKSKLL
jgi:SpoVK/Ycf46/Vps4 family AAA+-type ATPase